MINYSKAKIYFIKRQDTGEVIWSGGTVSSLKRRYYNHISNKKDILHQIVNGLDLDWSNLKIEMIKDYHTCRDRMRLSFAAAVALQFYRHDNEDVLNDFLDNINYYIE